MLLMEDSEEMDDIPDIQSMLQVNLEESENEEMEIIESIDIQTKKEADLFWDDQQN